LRRQQRALWELKAAIKKTQATAGLGPWPHKLYLALERVAAAGLSLRHAALPKVDKEVSMLLCYVNAEAQQLPPTPPLYGTGSWPFDPPKSLIGGSLSGGELFTIKFHRGQKK